MDLLIRARFDVVGCSEAGSMDLVEIVGAAAVPRKGELIHIHPDYSAFYVDEIMHDFTEGLVIVRVTILKEEAEKLFAVLNSECLTVKDYQ